MHAAIEWLPHAAIRPVLCFVTQTASNHTQFVDNTKKKGWVYGQRPGATAQTRLSFQGLTGGGWAQR